MAPSNGAARPQPPARSKQAVKPVVPLPYIKRQPAPVAVVSLPLGHGTGEATNGHADDASPTTPADVSEPSPSIVSNGEAFAPHGPGLEAADNGLSKAPEPPFFPQAASPTQHHVPALFARPMPIMANGDMPRGPLPHPPNGPHPVHQQHPSNGSIYFGTLHDSQGSSPAPPPSGGIPPPPGMAGPDGRPPYMGLAGNGFAPMMPFPGEVLPMNNVDNFGRPTAGYGPVDPFPPYGANYGPSTPRSFHDSQSSGHPDDGAMFGHFPHRNGGPVMGDDVNVQRRMFGPVGLFPGLGIPPPMPPGNLENGLIGYLQQQFARPEFADCTLELRYPADRAPPVRIPAHRLILCRSADLAIRLQQTASDAAGPPTVVVEGSGRWMRSDAFYTATQSLYGLPLLQMPLHGRTDPGDVMEAGPVKEQLDFCLSYAAAGYVIGWWPVTRRGCEVAMQLLGWHTLETTVDFALDGFADMGSHDVYKLGEGSRSLLMAVISFIVHNLPPTFSIDTTVEDAESYCRLPVRLPAPASSTASVEASPPAMTRVPSVQFGKGRRPQQISHIQFGDLSMSESETPKATRIPQPASHAILSRVLVNLPFSQLKMLVELPPASANLHGWMAMARTVKAAVVEREARRQNAVEAVMDGRVAVPDAVRAALRSPTPQDAGQWSLLGWQEEMMLSVSPEETSLIRKWVPLMEAHNGVAAEYP
ncbi:hypothetical protein CDD80_4005 [Ophiocordyceps camponoti-rufipedis]|uniref:Uncharacterized protein n=1 Tax=Ophiocordyceps camponoti-rufipedis TaxID=2004952 RepID=A0A2C5XI26_9HYPO|nr:hypothetical protein CDD80_4005 [Ophiocordyceps camponoti-rufipedis]